MGGIPRRAAPPPGRVTPRHARSRGTATSGTSHSTMERCAGFTVTATDGGGSWRDVGIEDRTVMHNEKCTMPKTKKEERKLRCIRLAVLYIVEHDKADEHGF